VALTLDKFADTPGVRSDDGKRWSRIFHSLSVALQMSAPSTCHAVLAVLPVLALQTVAPQRHQMHLRSINRRPQVNPWR
jgi:hypothetical protein